ncbi:hypothetical protein PV325_003140 [Microctonus aethiopoides]|nr:hypothetical protein PV325_003140 [Microctonus aethiopoides]
MMNYNTQTNVSRKKIVSSQEKTSSRRDKVSKKNQLTSDELTNKKLPIQSSKDYGNSSNTMIKNTKRSLSKSLLQQDSVESLSSSVSRSKFSSDRPIIDQSVNSLINVKHQPKILTNVSSISPKTNTNVSSIKSKSKKLVSSNDEKRGVSTIYMPKKKSFNAKESNESTKKDRNKSTIVKNKDSNSSDASSSNNINTNSQKVPSTLRKKSRTLSPSEVKVLTNNKKTSEVSSSISLSKKSFSQRDSSSDCDYEDDFEDYESDFQECTDSEDAEASQVSDESELIDNEPEPEPIELQTQKIEKKIITNLPMKKYNDEEHMLDSGHYEIHEARRRAARLDLMTVKQNAQAIASTIKCSIYTDEKLSEAKSLPSSADEGFEDGRSGDFAKSTSIPGTLDSINPKQHDIIPSEKQIKQTNRRLTRGKQLLQMIKLDIVQWSLYESIPIAYEEFIRIHGKMNTRQISTQTNDDNLSVEVQTDEIEYKNMWTQFPISCRSTLKNNDDINLFTAELAGVGGDENNLKLRPQYDVLELNEFLNTAGNIILAILENKQSQKINSIGDNTNTQQLSFSDVTTRLSINNVTFLSNRPITMIRYSDISSKILLTIHDCGDDDEVETAVNEDIYIMDCCIGCLWNIFEPSRPIKLFYSRNNITACCLHPTNYNIVFGGLEDGSLSLWDLCEDKSYHHHVIDKENKNEWTLRSVTFNSGGNPEDQSNSKIVSLTVLSKVETNIANDVGKFMPLQICSLNEQGDCIVWSVLKNFEGTSLINQDLGQSWWGKLRLMKSHEIRIDVRKEININNIMFDFRDISVDSININNLYIAANISQVLHVTRFGAKPKPASFDGIDCIGGATCIEMCPFGQPFFLVGREDGSIQLYSSTLEKPLLQLRNLNSNASIKTIQWSKSKPLTIYVLDDDAKIHIWDLTQSSDSPVCTVTPDKYAHVISMQLSPCRTDHEMTSQYMAIGLDNGTVEIHKFNQQYHHSNKNELSSELKVFFNYLKIY